ncbi:DNA-3-methyladenine glycosylase I [Hoeflea sp. YIM 152468]|uniref:DNA-3-methyladenine glycosylase I n=1 Tax=Hoeflea sp. YIM 152468 TaxID=3031759 RepID=UPI0023DA8F1A|nr:DNA-3-methyladenine glycosylase I [Hoeflea sp. YIM 152468]MDF1608426.1 DNA-3-methyladenine glycosylase I [Hoeflea sp. YIM 152468]
MRSFDDIFDIAAARKGGADVLNAMLAPPKASAELAAIADDRWLAAMTRGVFQAGFSWKVVDSMWPGFEAAFDGFDIGHCAMLNDEDFDRLVSDTRIIRNGAKIRSVQQNAVFVQALAAESGSAGKAIAGWPSTDFVGLLDLLKKRGSRLGGTTAQYCLRSQGKDSFILSESVTARLIAEGVIDKPATSKKALADIQAAFNVWMDQSGRSLTEISRVLAMSL